MKFCLLLVSILISVVAIPSIDGRRHDDIKGNELVYTKSDIDRLLKDVKGTIKTNRYPMFCIELNDVVGNMSVTKDDKTGAIVDFEYPAKDDPYSFSEWTEFELKASTNNFYTTDNNATLRIAKDDGSGILTNISKTVKGIQGVASNMVFFCMSNQLLEFYEYDDKRDLADPIESMRKYVNSYEVNGIKTDGRGWTFYQTNGDLKFSYPPRVIVILDPSKFTHCKDNSWCHDHNPDIVWSFLRGNIGEHFEKDVHGDYVWRPIKPVCWFSELPAWAYTNGEVRVISESQYKKENE